MSLILSENDLLNVKIILVRKYDSVAAHRTAKTKQRTAEFYEMSYYLSGNGSVNINDTEYPIEPGYVRFVRPGDRVYSTPHFSCLTVNFELSSSNGFVEERIFSDIEPYFYAGNDTEGMFQKIIENSYKGTDENYLAQLSELMLILYRLCRISKKSGYPSEVEKCIRYMDENFASKVTLKQLGELSGYSAIHLHRMFLQSTGYTPHSYLTGIRIRHAKDLLADKSLTLEDISQKCGFSSLSHFKTVFKQHAGKTPGAFRREIESYL